MGANLSGGHDDDLLPGTNVFKKWLKGKTPFPLAVNVCGIADFFAIDYEMAP